MHYWGEANLTFSGSVLNINGTSDDTPLMIDTASNNGAHLRFRKDGSNQHFVGSGGGFSLGDKEDLSFRAYDNLLFATGNSSTERMRISSEGYVTKANQPSFHARRVNNASSTSNPLVFDDAHHNNGSHYKTSGTDQGKFVAPVAGVYLFYWCAIKTNSGSVCRLYIKKNGSNIYGSMHLRLQESGTYSNGSIQAILNLAAGDKIHISLEAGSIHGSEYTHFGGYLIH